MRRSASLPDAVKQFGVTIKKASTDMVCVVNLVSPDGRYDATFLDNYGQTTVADVLRRIPGVGEQKFKDYAEPFLIEIEKYLATSPRRTFRDEVDSSLPRRQVRLNDSQTDTLRRFQRGETVEEIARARGFVHSTIYGHLLAAIECGKLPHARVRFFTPVQEKEIAAAFHQVPGGTLTDISAILRNKYDIGLLRIFRELKQEGTASQPFRENDGLEAVIP